MERASRESQRALGNSPAPAAFIDEGADTSKWRSRSRAHPAVPFAFKRSGLTTRASEAAKRGMIRGVLPCTESVQRVQKRTHH
jgi:hypothetical protein